MGSLINLNRERWRRSLEMAIAENQGAVGSMSDNDRYVPQATGERPGAWAIFDRKLDRFCTPEEVAALTPETINEKLPLN